MPLREGDCVDDKEPLRDGKEEIEPVVDTFGDSDELPLREREYEGSDEGVTVGGGVIVNEIDRVGSLERDPDSESDTELLTLLDAESFDLENDPEAC